MGGWIPDRFMIFWKGNLVADSSFVANANHAELLPGTYDYDIYDDPDYSSPLLSFGPSTATTQLTITQDMLSGCTAPTAAGTHGTLTFEKTEYGDPEVTVWV